MWKQLFFLPIVTTAIAFCSRDIWAPAYQMVNERFLPPCIPRCRRFFILLRIASSWSQGHPAFCSYGMFFSPLLQQLDGSERLLHKKIYSSCRFAWSLYCYLSERPRSKLCFLSRSWQLQINSCTTITIPISLTLPELSQTGASFSAFRASVLMVCHFLTTTALRVLGTIHWHFTAFVSVVLVTHCSPRMAVKMPLMWWTGYVPIRLFALVFAFLKENSSYSIAPFANICQYGISSACR